VSSAGRPAEGGIELRPFTEADVPALVEACQDPEIPRWTRVPTPYGEAEARAFVAGHPNIYAFAVVDAETGELLGSVGFGLAGEAWRVRLLGEARGPWAWCGIASSAPLAARRAVAEHGLRRLQLVVEPENEASIRVAENAGFRREGLLRSTSRSGASAPTFTCTRSWPRSSSRR
jgi:RimJ/RimL family protein N-acetyltransferase